NTNSTDVTELGALGQPAAADGTTVVLGDWGSLRRIESGAHGTTATGNHGFVTALDIHLTADHGGLPAGTSILVGYAEVAAEAAPPEPVAPAPKARGKKGPKVKKAAPEPKLGLPPIRQPPRITPPLKTPGGH